MLNRDSGRPLGLIGESRRKSAALLAMLAAENTARLSFLRIVSQLPM